MIRVCAPSRLHFGVLSLPSGENATGRQFGGVGLMVREPGVRLAVRPAAAWSAEGPLAERALAFANLFARSLPPGTPARPCHLVVEHSAPEHMGLGTGTQLGLAVARAVAAVHGLGEGGAAELALRVGRGARSALGIHGFDRGGLLVEAGKVRPEGVAPLVARLDFPEPWRVVLVLPAGRQGLHGEGEAQAFRTLAGRGPRPATTDALCRLVLLGLLPAAAEADLPAFGEALYEFNRLVGEAFRPAQGGTYAHPGSEEVVAFIRRLGVGGVGQSSWGPGLFAVAADAGRAEDLAGRLRQRFGFGPGEALVTQAANQGAALRRAAV